MRVCVCVVEHDGRGRRWMDGVIEEAEWWVGMCEWVSVGEEVFDD